MHKLLIIFVLIPVVTFSDNFTDSLKIQLSAASNQNKIEILQTITKHYLFENVDSCLKYGTLVVELANENKDQEQEAIACKRMGYANYRIGNYDQSISYYKRALEGYLEIKEYLDAAVITNFLGITYSQKSDYTKALDYYIVAEKSCDTLIISHSDKESVKRLYSILFTNKGLLYHELDSINVSLKYFNKALKYAEEIEDSTRITACYSNIGMIYKANKEYSLALAKYSEALKITNILGNKDYEIAILNNIANIHSALGEQKTSLDYYLKTKQIILETGDKYGLALVNRNIASVNNQLGYFNIAIDLYLEALDISLEIGNLKEEYYCYEGLSKVYENNGDYKKAFLYQSQYLILKDSVSGVETREKIADIQTRYETERKEKENISLRKNNEIQQLQLSRKNLLIVFLISGIIAFVVLSIIIYLLYRKRHIAYKQLVKKNLDLINCEKKTLLNPGNKNENTNHQNGEQTKNLAMIFDTYMKKEKPFLFSEISYDEVCKKLNTNRTYLSKAINESYNKSFSEVINNFRIKEASLYLSDPKYNHLSIEGIGQMTGFNYKAAFFSNFKKQVGITPSFFRKNAQG